MHNTQLGSPTPTFTSIPEIAREAGVTGRTVAKFLKTQGVMADGFLTAGRMTMPIFATPRFAALVDLVKGNAPSPMPEAQV